MATKNFVPRANNEGGLGTTTKRWNKVVVTDANITGSITDGVKSKSVANIADHIDSTANPHNVTKAQVGLGNVQNVDTTNASNITTGTLPTSVLPSLAITDTYVAANETAQLALTVQKGDVVVRTDESKTYINITGSNSSMADWQLILSPVDSVLSVNGKTGTVVLSTTDIGEGTNLYYTDARVTASPQVTANTNKLATIESGAQVNLFEFDGNLDIMPKA